MRNPPVSSHLAIPREPGPERVAASLVVGGGSRGRPQGPQGLLAAGAQVTVVAPEAVDEIAEDHRVRWHQRPYRRGEVASYRLAVTATGDPKVDGQVYWDAEAADVWLNSSRRPRKLLVHPARR